MTAVIRFLATVFAVLALGVGAGAGRFAHTAIAASDLPVAAVTIGPALAPSSPPAPAEVARVLAPAPSSGLAPEPEPAWRQHAVATTPSDGRPRIAVVLDDVGVHVPNGQRALGLPAPVTMAIMTYAQDAAALAARARANGHELLVHVPMEPEDDTWNTGPNALRASLGPEELGRRIEWALGRFDGAVGINNHMGSRFTADAAAMAVLMEALGARGMLFLDSLTTNRSAGRRTARAAEVTYVARDVFLDNDPDPESVWSRIAEVEVLARRNGSAVAVGHPKGVTLQVLKEWLPSLAERGFVLVPLSALVGEAAPKLARIGG
jgi:polysaccharide deacetylase 2 family uncharacterized protein YibQ